MPGVRFDKTLFGELIDGYIRDYERNGKRSIRREKQISAHLRGHLGKYRAAEVDNGMIEGYIEKRLADAVSDATINRELAGLKRMFNLGAKAGIPERVAMMVSGHKPRSIFDRYNIVSGGDLREAAEKQAAYLEKVSGLGTNLGTIEDFPPKPQAGTDSLSPCNKIISNKNAPVAQADRAAVS